MAATVEDLRRWFRVAKKNNATHMIIVCDTFEYDDYPVYVMPHEDVQTVFKRYNGPNMQRIMGVYSTSKTLEQQGIP